MRNCIPAYASSLGPTGVAEQAEACRSIGFGSVKVKVGFGLRTDAANLKSAREVLGGDVILLADANQAWNLDEAVAMAPVLHKYGVELVEEPLADSSVEALEEFARRTSLKVALGENVYGRGAFTPYLESPAVSVVQPDVSKTGGLTEAFEICKLAADTGTSVIPHLYGSAVAYAATLQLAACALSIDAIEYDVRANPLRDPLMLNTCTPTAGIIDLPDGPGLGVKFDFAAAPASAQCHYEDVAAPGVPIGGSAIPPLQR